MPQSKPLIVGGERGVLTVKYEPIRPVELLDLTASLHALGAQYRQFAEEQATVPPDRVRLFINELRTGSIIAELKAYADQVTFLYDHTDSLAAFATHINDLAQFFLGLLPARIPATKKEANQLSQFMEPIAKDGGSQVFLTAGPSSSVVINHYHFDSASANAIQNGVRRFVGKDLPEGGYFEKELLFIRQARDDPRGRTGDRGVIEKFSQRAVKLLFMSEEAKRRIIEQPENPFRLAFIVDGYVGTIEGEPALYKIYTVHESFERPDA